MKAALLGTPLVPQKLKRDAQITWLYSYKGITGLTFSGCFIILSEY